MENKDIHNQLTEILVRLASTETALANVNQNIENLAKRRLDLWNTLNPLVKQVATLEERNRQLELSQQRQHRNSMLLISAGLLVVSAVSVF